METPRRTLAKAILWNVIVLLVMSIVGLVMIGSDFVGGSVATINTALGLGCYILYERAWARVGWGRGHG